LPPENAERLREALRVAREEIARLDHIVSQFLRAVRPTRPDLQRVSINDIVTETVTLVEREIRDRNILVVDDQNRRLRGRDHAARSCWLAACSRRIRFSWIGSLMRTVVPRPASLSTSIVPPCSRTMRCTIINPSPLPSSLVV